MKNLGKILLVLGGINLFNCSSDKIVGPTYENKVLSKNDTTKTQTDSTLNEKIFESKNNVLIDTTNQVFPPAKDTTNIESKITPEDRIYLALLGGYRGICPEDRDDLNRIDWEHPWYMDWTQVNYCLYILKKGYGGIDNLDIERLRNDVSKPDSMLIAILLNMSVEEAKRKYGWLPGAYEQGAGVCANRSISVPYQSLNLAGLIQSNKEVKEFLEEGGYGYGSLKKPDDEIIKYLNRKMFEGIRTIKIIE